MDFCIKKINLLKNIFDYQKFQEKNVICKLNNKIENLNNKYLGVLSRNGILILENV